jgi:AraC-like DNA-binding protein
MQLLEDIIKLTPFYITAFWGIVFIFNPVKENRARYGLGIFMLTASVIYFSHAVFFEGNYSLYLKIDELYLLTGLSVYPLYYLYIRLLTKDITFKKSYLLHLLPAIVLSALLGFFSLHASPSAEQVYLKDVIIQNHWPKSTPQSTLAMMAFIYFLSRVIFGLQSLVYLFLSIILIRKYNKRVSNFYSDLSGKKLIWLELITITLVATAISSFLLNILGRHFFEHDHLLFIPSMVFSLLLFTIGLLGNKQNQTVADVVEDENAESIDYEKPNSKIRLKERLLDLMEKEKPYLNPEFRITDLSPKLFTNRTYLSHLINSEFKMSFSDFVNRYRVQHAKTLMKNNLASSYSLIYYSEQSGFGSVSSFLRAFKQAEGITAGAYHRDLEKAS